MIIHLFYRTAFFFYLMLLHFAIYMLWYTDWYQSRCTCTGPVVLHRGAYKLQHIPLAWNAVPFLSARGTDAEQPSGEHNMFVCGMGKNKCMCVCVCMYVCACACVRVCVRVLGFCFFYYYDIIKRLWKVSVILAACREWFPSLTQSHAYPGEKKHVYMILTALVLPSHTRTHTRTLAYTNTHNLRRLHYLL